MLPMPDLLAFHAHPDDESISMGGTLAEFAAGGSRVVVVTATDGVEGEVHNYDEVEQIKARLDEVRAEELRAALDILGVENHEFLGYRDSGMMGEPSNLHPDCFWRADFVDAIGRLIALIRRYRPDTMTIYDPFGGYGHPDHIQVHRIGLAAFYMAEDTVRFPLAHGEELWQPARLWMSVWPRSRFVRWAQLSGSAVPGKADRVAGYRDEEVTVWVDVRHRIDQKVEAIRAHRSQIPPGWALLNVPEEYRGELLGSEAFVELFQC